MTFLWYRPLHFSHLNAQLIVSIRITWFTQQKQWALSKTRSPAASLPFKGQDTEQTTVKWSIAVFDWFSVFIYDNFLIFIVQWIWIRVFPLLPLNLAPSPVREVSIPPEKITSYSIEVRWLPPEKRNGEIGYYFFYWESSAGSTTAESFVIPGSVHYKLVSGLKPFTNYTFSVVPYNLRKNLSGHPFDREGQTSATCMYFTAFTRKFTNGAWKNHSPSWKSKSRHSVLRASTLFRRICLRAI